MKILKITTAFLLLVITLSSCKKTRTCTCTVDTEITYQNSVSVNGQLYPTHLKNTSSLSKISIVYDNRKDASCFDRTDHSEGNASTTIEISNFYPTVIGLNVNQTQTGPSNFYQTVLVPYRSTTSYEHCVLF